MYAVVRFYLNLLLPPYGSSNFFMVSSSAFLMLSASAFMRIVLPCSQAPAHPAMIEVSVKIRKSLYRPLRFTNSVAIRFVSFFAASRRTLSQQQIALGKKDSIDSRCQGCVLLKKYDCDS